MFKITAYMADGKEISEAGESLRVVRIKLVEKILQHRFPEMDEENANAWAFEFDEDEDDIESFLDHIATEPEI